MALSPDVGHSKYMYLGQIHTGQEAVDFYTKGIEVLLSALNQQMTVSVTGAHSIGVVLWGSRPETYILITEISDIQCCFKVCEPSRHGHCLWEKNNDIKILLLHISKTHLENTASKKRVSLFISAKVVDFFFWAPELLHNK